MSGITPINVQMPQISGRQAYKLDNGKVIYAKSMPTIRDEFNVEHKKNGLVERLYNGFKNLTGLGVGSKKAEEAVRKAEAGEISVDDARNVIDKYRKSQVNSAQAFGDIMSVGASGMTFFGVRNSLKKAGAKAVLNEKATDFAIDIFGFGKKMLGIGKSKTKAVAIAAVVAALVGGIVKWGTLKFNRIGSEEFKYSKKEYNGAKEGYDKLLYRAEKKDKNKKRRGANFRNFVSGALNGVMMPITMLGAAIIGVPTYYIANSLNRYFIGNHEEKGKNLKGYVNNLKGDAVAHAAVVAATAVPMVTKVKYTQIFDANLKKVVDKLKDATLKDAGLPKTTSYQQLDDILRNSEAIRNITNNEALSVEDRIIALTDENLFAVKMRQISNDGSKLTTALRENCPPSRTLDEAQIFINKALGDKYTVKQLIGVGTVAETYLATDKSGKEVCVKILKNGITTDKLLADKAKFVDIVKNSKKSPEEIKNLLRNVDDMAEGLLKELDLVNEKDAAEKMVKFTKVANVVKPIEVKNGAYVMEKAKGISLSSLVELNSAKAYKEALESGNMLIEDIAEYQLKGRLGTLLKGVKGKEERLKIVNDYIKRIEARTPQYGDINLSKDDFIALIEEYQQVLVEQFNKVDADGKILHADIHPGNIFIDIDALKGRKGGVVSNLKSHIGRPTSNKIFTLIDTGNTVAMNKEQGLRAINLTSYIKRGNVKDITDYMLYGVDGAALGGHTKEEAAKLISNDLKKIFFDAETKLETVTNESLVEMVSNIMRKHGIVPADTQMTLNKARQSADNSLSELGDSLVYFYLKNILQSDSKINSMTELAKIPKDLLTLKNKYKQAIKVQERLNLQHLSPEQVKLHKNNPNMLKTNSEDFLTYSLKQAMKEKINIPTFN